LQTLNFRWKPRSQIATFHTKQRYTHTPKKCQELK
jgi:hypothetical protein